jgi:hypothetical protein
MFLFTKASMHSAFFAESQADVCCRNIVKCLGNDKQRMEQFPEGEFGTVIQPLIAIVSLGTRSLVM